MHMHMMCLENRVYYSLDACRACVKEKIKADWEGTRMLAKEFKLFTWIM